MHQLKFAPVMVLLLFCVGCCSKVDCPSVGAGIKITNVKDSSIFDSVLVCRYDQHTDFAQPLDSFWTQCSPGAEDSSAWYIEQLGYGLNLHSDYKVVFPKAGRDFRVDKLETGQRTCNSCLFTKDMYSVLARYQVNGETYETDKDFAGIALRF